MQQLRVRNWNKWQSYRRDRGQPPWIKVHREIMRNLDWVALTDAQRGQLVAIWLLAADRDGVVPASPEIIKKLCYMDSEPDIKTLIDHGFLEHDVTVTPERRQDDVTVTPERRQHDAPETETETEKDPPLPPQGGGAATNGYAVLASDRRFHAQIVAAYHETLPDLPRVRDWNDRRRRKLAARIRERIRAGKDADKLEYWLNVFRKARDSDFLMGRKTDWRCPGLEWLLEPKNFTKLIEGAYDNHGRG